MPSTGASSSIEVESSSQSLWIERAQDVALGVSALGWGIAGEVSAPPHERFALVRVTLTLLNVAVGLLFLLRAPVIRRGSTTALLASLPSMVVSALALKLTPTFRAWPLPMALGFAFGAAFAMSALGSLGRSFAVFPSLRAVVTRGPYRWLRHPAYAGELVMVAACAGARGDFIGAGLLLLSLVLVVLRIRAEEQTLSGVDYAAYVARVRFRLVPGVW